MVWPIAWRPATAPTAFTTTECSSPSRVSSLNPTKPAGYRLQKPTGIHSMGDVTAFSKALDARPSAVAVIRGAAGGGSNRNSSFPPVSDFGGRVTESNKEVFPSRSTRSPSRSSVPPPGTLRAQAEGVGQFGDLVAVSPAMQAALGLAARYAPVDVSLTLIGETGTGKDVLAREIHAQSARSNCNFVVFDCGSVASNLAESELLGHERGAFTGAVAAHTGAFERADGGSLFLDEIGELPLDLQPKLLRALENRRGRRVGGSEDRPFDVRIIAATNRDLRTEVAAGRFRRDLYFRLGAAVISVPPLRERLEDLPRLVQELLEDLGRSDLSLTDDALTLLRFRSWPGNVRELKNTLACAVTFVEPDENTVESSYLGAVFDSDMNDGGDIERLPLGGQRLDRIERAAILQTLSQAGGNKVRAAHVLGIAVSTLYEKLKKYE